MKEITKNPQKEIKGTTVAAILKHTLSLPTTEVVTSEEKVEREMRRYQDQGVTNCCQISYTLPEIPFEISEITEIPKSEIKDS